VLAAGSSITNNKYEAGLISYMYGI
jgi:hypothetical protein